MNHSPAMDQEKVIAYGNAAYDAYQRDDRETYAEVMRNYQDYVILVCFPLYGDVVHIDHVYRGLFALRDRDTKLARLELLKAGRPPAGTLIKFFGPNCLLASELLKLGERKPVLDFLVYCKAFWLLPVRVFHLPQWISTIKRGEMPDFGRNLRVGLTLDREPLRRDYPREG